MNNRLFVSGDVSLNNRLFVSGDVSLNNRLFVRSDLSVNGGVGIDGDVMIRGRLNVREYQNTNIFYTNVTSTNYNLVVSEDISLNGRLSVAGDISLNGRIFLPATGNIFIGNTAISIQGPTGQQGIQGTQGTQGIQGIQGTQGIQGPTGTVSGTYQFTGDLSVGTRLFVSSDTSLSGNVLTKSLSILLLPSSIVASSSFSQNTWNSYSNSGYIGCSISSNGNTLLYSSANPYGDGSIFYSTGYGKTGIITVSNASNPIYNTSFGYANITDIEIAANGLGLAIACSSNYGLFTSTNSGVTWSQATTASTSFKAVAMSSNGAYSAAVDSNGTLYISTNSTVSYSSSYSTSMVGSTVSALSVSDNGSRVIATVQNTNTIYYSSNGGTSFTSVSPSGNSNTGWLSLSMDGSGTYAIAGSSANGIFYSNNGGQSWTQSNFNYSMTFGSNLVLTSNRNTGQYCIALTYGRSSYSTDYGQTWFFISSLNSDSNINSNLFYSVCLSPDGINALLLAPGGIYYSTNSTTLLPMTSLNSDLSMNGRIFLPASSSGNNVYFGSTLAPLSYGPIASYSSATQSLSTAALSYVTFSSVGTTFSDGTYSNYITQGATSTTYGKYVTAIPGYYQYNFSVLTPSMSTSGTTFRIIFNYLTAGNTSTSANFSSTVASQYLSNNTTAMQYLIPSSFIYKMSNVNDAIFYQVFTSSTNTGAYTMNLQVNWLRGL
jgi:hypothetical protein